MAPKKKAGRQPQGGATQARDGPQGSTGPALRPAWVLPQPLPTPYLCSQAKRQLAVPKTGGRRHVLALQGAGPPDEPAPEPFDEGLPQLGEQLGAAPGSGQSAASPSTAEALWQFDAPPGAGDAEGEYQAPRITLETPASDVQRLASSAVLTCACSRLIMIPAVAGAACALSLGRREASNGRSVSKPACADRRP